MTRAENYGPSGTGGLTPATLHGCCITSLRYSEKRSSDEDTLDYKVTKTAFWWARKDPQRWLKSNIWNGYHGLVTVLGQLLIPTRHWSRLPSGNSGSRLGCAWHEFTIGTMLWYCTRVACETASSLAWRSTSAACCCHLHLLRLLWRQIEYLLIQHETNTKREHVPMGVLSYSASRVGAVIILQTNQAAQLNPTCFGIKKVPFRPILCTCVTRKRVAFVSFGCIKRVFVYFHVRQSFSSLWGGRI